jgi:hypothetical protein
LTSFSSEKEERKHKKLSSIAKNRRWGRRIFEENRLIQMAELAYDKFRTRIMIITLISIQN